MKENLGLIVLESHKELGEKIHERILRKRNVHCNYMVEIQNDRFCNGEGKIKILDSVQGKDIYILADVGNYDLTYQMHGFTNHISPDEHYQDIKRVISAMSGHAKKIHVIMPLLYQSRQHKRKGRESLDCAVALRELESLGVDNIITIDAHDGNICNAIPNTSFYNIYPTQLILEQLKQEVGCADEMVVISPDMGATVRSRYYADCFKCDMGIFYKRRDLSKVVHGKNPVIEHAYMGPDVKGKCAVVVDDMIASGESMLEVGKALKEKGAKSVYFIATFALFTEGIEKFIEAHQKGYFDRIYSTNASYIAKEIVKQKWFTIVDMSVLLADIIDHLNHGESLEEYFH